MDYSMIIIKGVKTTHLNKIKRDKMQQIIISKSRNSLLRRVTNKIMNVIHFAKLRKQSTGEMSNPIDNDRPKLSKQNSKVSEMIQYSQ